ncbi:hypothetical protein ACOSP7_031044 [Xanthoceras sorbifolium]
MNISNKVQQLNPNKCTKRILLNLKYIFPHQHAKINLNLANQSLQAPYELFKSKEDLYVTSIIRARRLCERGAVAVGGTLGLCEVDVLGLCAIGAGWLGLCTVGAGAVRDWHWVLSAVGGWGYTWLALGLCAVGARAVSYSRLALGAG